MHMNASIYFPDFQNKFQTTFGWKPDNWELNVPKYYYTPFSFLHALSTDWVAIVGFVETKQIKYASSKKWLFPSALLELNVQVTMILVIVSSQVENWK